VFKSTDKLKKLTIEFYNQKNVTAIARQLLGKILVTNIDGNITSGRIIETEAYAAITDKASHAWAGKRTVRNEYMYAQAATAYVYICYGIHQMFNVVTNKKGIPDAVLIRAIEPMEGIDSMTERTGKSRADKTITKGPGNLSKALGIDKIHSGENLLHNRIYIMRDDTLFTAAQIGVSKRIGVDYAGPDAFLPYRFYVKGNKYVSGKPCV
jgi:DNA-3-methyladenine glycosylase